MSKKQRLRVCQLDNWAKIGYLFHQFKKQKGEGIKPQQMNFNLKLA